jgi:hypothetical protein
VWTLQETGSELVSAAAPISGVTNGTLAWKQLAEDMKGVLTIAELDCEANKAVCKKEGVPGFPQLVL